MPAPPRPMTKNKPLMEFIQANGDRCALFLSPTDKIYRLYDRPGIPLKSTADRAEAFAAFDMLVATRIAASETQS